MDIENFTWFGGDSDCYPTDLSLQFTFKFKPLQSTCQLGLPSPFWYYEEKTKEEIGEGEHMID